MTTTEIKEPNVYTIAQLMAFDDLPSRVFEVVDVDTPAISKKGIGDISYHPSMRKGMFCLNSVNPVLDYAAIIKGVDIDSKDFYHYISLELRVKEVFDRTEQLEKNILFNKKAADVARIELVLNKNHIGADPEIFAEDKDGNLIPSFTYLPSKKQNPDMYWDGYQGEFTVDSSHCIAYVVDSIHDRLRRINIKLKSYDPEAELSLLNTFVIPADRLAKDDKKYVDFGCTPSKNVYGETFPNVRSRDVPFRSAGGHLHFSITEDHKKFIPDAVKWLDKVLGVISVSMFQYYDDPRRRTMYGRAGEYRTPAHGLEYRVLSNAWLCHPAIVHFIYDMARRAAGFGLYQQPFTAWDITEEEARQCINTCDVGMAQKLLERNAYGLDILLRSYGVLIHAVSSEAIIDKWKSIIMEGVHKYLSNPDRLSRAWRIDKDGGYWKGHSESELANMSMTINHLLEHNKLD